MVDVLDIISKSAKLYVKQWRKVILAYAVILFLSLVLGPLSGILSTLVLLALIIPLKEIADRKKVSNWSNYLGPQLLNFFQGISQNS